MYQDDEPLNASGTPRKFASIKPAAPAVPHAGSTTVEAAEDALFEDILEIEGALRMAMASVAGFGAPATGQVERGIGELAGRIPDEDFVLLRAHAQALTAATDNKDAAQVRSSQVLLVDALTSLRRMLA